MEKKDQPLKSRRRSPYHVIQLSKFKFCVIIFVYHILYDFIPNLLAMAQIPQIQTFGGCVIVLIIVLTFMILYFFGIIYSTADSSKVIVLPYVLYRTVGPIAGLICAMVIYNTDANTPSLCSDSSIPFMGFTSSQVSTLCVIRKTAFFQGAIIYWISSLNLLTHLLAAVLVLTVFVMSFRLQRARREENIMSCFRSTK
ncbi:unnamed protein product [Didymodactylos carnosus]|uniref:Uncharacterized protein n=1 Tax=Didymodactylos carnosus TaxID=1234261 RepID=A0A814G7G3_9BILA|nr:unnamed protein product [Didymodactylos carnosus]CAF1215871.1 unnamed protein product [Didymodactylos carnosus]CAF3762055.1 unnamed protein product [Didymodactylos carnosus]CAF4024356.1 unnamed protein product [Didymodactylos carnosus]